MRGPAASILLAHNSPRSKDIRSTGVARARPSSSLMCRAARSFIALSAMSRVSHPVPSARMAASLSPQVWIRLSALGHHTRHTGHNNRDGRRSASLRPEPRWTSSPEWRQERDLCLWDAETGARMARFRGHSSPIVSCALSPDGTEAVSGSIDRTVRLWNAGDDSDSGEDPGTRAESAQSPSVAMVAVSPPLAKTARQGPGTRRAAS